jgi:aryl-alcohol dehydrogenase-like predicted oxidoreductase
MEYVRLGSTGIKVSRICLGCMSFGQRTEHWPWALDEEDSRPLIKRALELGINFFDTANAYSDGTSEVVVGIGTTKPHHLDDAVAALSIQLTPDEIEQMEEAYAPHIVRGHRQFSVCD